MKISTIVLWGASRFPWAGRVIVWLWGQAYFLIPKEPHWLFLKLKSTLKMRLRKRVPFITGKFIYVDPYDVVGGEIARQGCYEPETVDLFRAMVRPGMVVVDAGAHIGQYTLIASLAVGEKGKIHSFEPDPATFGMLQKNVVLNRCANVVCNRTALSNENGQAILYQSDVANIGANSLRQAHHYAGSQNVISVTTLDNYASSNRFDRLDVIKADIEGAELLLLTGGVETIKRFSPSLVLEFSVLEEAFGYTRQDLQKRLLDWQYSIFRIDGFPLRPYLPESNEKRFFNVLALPSCRLDELRKEGVIQ